MFCSSSSSSSSSSNGNNKNVMEDPYIETPFDIIGSYFRGRHLDQLARHQIESFNNFVNYQLPRTIEMFNKPEPISSELDYNSTLRKSSLEIYITFENFKLFRPQIHENNGAIKLMFPQEARDRNFTYAGVMTVDINVKYVIRTGKELENIQTLYKVIKDVHIGKLPFMVKSSICLLTQYKHVDERHTGECKFDTGGYFIINGSEKTVLGQERAAENKIYCFNISKNNTKYNWMAEIKSVPDSKCISPKQINLLMSSKSNGFGFPIYVQIPKIKQPIPLFIVFRALGIKSDKEICETILLDIEKETELLALLQASVVDANQTMTSEDALKYVTSFAVFPPVDVDKEKALAKKTEFTLEILTNDLFPHCQNVEQRIHFLGYMANRLLQVVSDRVKQDDRDSYLNKRIDLTGALLNNLFRNYFNKLVRDMERLLKKEINTGSWRSTDNYLDIITETNIYKIIKPTTIENGIKRALSTGDFSIKHAAPGNNTKVGVAQVLNRLTYVSKLSHLRRISTPIDKSGKLIPPRKLHSTSWAFLCLAGDSNVLLSNRIDSRMIKDVKNGDLVNTVNRESLLDEPSDIYNYFCKMPDKLFQIKTISGRNIKATSDHPFLVKVSNGKYEMKKLGELDIATDKLVIRHMVEPIADANTTVVILNESDVLEHYRMDLLEKNLLNVQLPTHKLKIIARLVGSLNTDGHVGCDSNNYYSAQFSLGEEYDVYQLADDIKSLGFENPSITRSIRRFENKENGRVSTSTTWTVSKSGSFAYFMYKLGAFAGSKVNMERSVCGWLINAELSIKREFLSAFQGGDGSRFSYQKNGATFKPNIGITTQTTHNDFLESTIEYMKQIKQMFEEYGINSHINNVAVDENKTKVCLVFEKSTANLAKYAEYINYTYCEEKRRASAPIIEHIKIRQQNKLHREKMVQYVIDNFETVNRKVLVEATGISLDQINKIVSKYKKGERQSARFTTDLIYDTFIRENIAENGCVCVPIESITEIAPEPVYDFTTRSNNHSFVASSFVLSNCPAETPEGQSVGVVKNLSCLAHVTIQSNSNALYTYVDPFIDKMSKSDMYNAVKIFVNGAWVGVTRRPMELYLDLKDKKYKGIINIYTAVVFDYKNKEIRVCNDAGRITRPVLKVKDRSILVTPVIVQGLRKHQLDWDDLVSSCVLTESIIEYIDPEEQNWSLIATSPKDLKNLENANLKYTHCEIHPSVIFGVLASCIPYPDHNQSPRNTYQCAQSKQAMGVYVSNFENRMDKTAYLLNYPMKPLVDTRIMNMIKLHKIPAGTNLIVAIMTHTGYNQEDSILVNQGSIDRGMALVTVFHTERDEDKQKLNGDEEIRCKPDPTKTKGMKMGNYNKVNSRGLIPENSLVENRDVIIAKVVPIKENRNDPTKVIKFEDQSRIYKTVEPTYIDKNYVDRNGDGYNFAKVRLRAVRKPVIGDKFCLTDDHDVLTLNRGWVPIAEIALDDLVAQLNRVNSQLEYVHPLETLVFDHEGEMYEVETQGVSQKVTLNHRMWVQKRDHPSYELVQAKDIFGKRIRFQSGGSPISNTEYEIFFGNETFSGIRADKFLVVLGVFMAEGWTYISEKDYIARIEFAANKPRVQEALAEACDMLGLNYSMNVKTFKWYINHKELATEFQTLSVGAVNKSLPTWTKLLSARQSRILLESMCLGDGHETETSLHYSTSSVKLRDDVQILSQHAGYTAYYVSRYPAGHTTTLKDGRNITHTVTSWDIGIRRKRLYPTLNHGHVHDQTGQTEEITEFHGKVYCLRVPSEVFLIRRNGKCSFTGNSSRHGQKGTVGNIIPECDMPFTASGIRPDIIINPHAIPSRMTIGQLKETVLGKTLLQLGLFGDGTSFGDLGVKEICEELLKTGFEAHGNELLHNGLTGEQHECSVFFGPVFYQRLKHMVNDKAHSRALGPMMILTRQPAEGRSRDGGLRFGEMEKDAMVSHGAARFTRGRMYDASDKYSVHVCNACGLIAAYNDEMQIHHCRTCGNRSDFAFVEIPYACKLLFQELNTMNIVPRLITK